MITLFQVRMLVSFLFLPSIVIGVSKVISHSLPPLQHTHHHPYNITDHPGHDHVYKEPLVVSHGLPPLHHAPLHHPHGEIISHGLPPLNLVFPAGNDHPVLPSEYLSVDQVHHVPPGDLEHHAEHTDAEPVGPDHSLIGELICKK